MSAQDRYRQIIESLVNGEKDEASALLHEAFVEKARDIWSNIVEQDEIVEDEIADEDLEEAIGDEESGDFLDDIEEDEDEIDSEEAFGEGEDEEDDGELDLDDDAIELAIDGEEEGDEEAPDAEEAMQNVEDALADLKAAFADIMGDEEGDDMEDDMEEEVAFESEEVEESEEETLEEEAKLSAVSVSHTDGSDGKGSPVSKGIEDPFGSIDGNKSGDDMVSKGGTEKGGKAPAPKKMEATGPQDAGDLKPAPKAKG